MARKRARRAVPRVDPQALAEFQAGIRKRYTDEEILDQLRACAAELGRSPTMREFEAHPTTRVHSQTVIARFGTWNAAKRQAGLMPRRFATRDELLACLRQLGETIGRVPTAKDIDEHRGLVPSKSLYWHTFGSLSNALREAGFDVPVGEERLERAIDQGVDARAPARSPAAVRRLEAGAAGRHVVADGVAGLPDVRGEARRLGDVPVPRPRAAARDRTSRLRRTARSANKAHANRAPCR